MVPVLAAKTSFATITVSLTAFAVAPVAESGLSSNDHLKSAISVAVIFKLPANETGALDVLLIVNV